MKIGILTFHRADNYGAFLQCYALYSYLKKKNVEVSIIDYRNHNIEDGYRIIPPARKNFVKWLELLLQNISAKDFKYKVVKRQKFRRSRKKLELSPSFNKNEILQGKASDYDCIITGSDQVFNPGFFGQFDDVYYLNFPGQYKKVSYAASIGSVDYINPNLDKYKQLLSSFDALSLREAEDCIFSEKLLDRVVENVVDPTLLLGRQEWDGFAKKEEGKEKYILLYYVEKNDLLFKMVKELQSKYSLPVITLNYCDEMQGKATTAANCGPEEFVALVRNATYIVTSSFHAAAFSCIYRKDIFIVPHTKTGGRIFNLAELFGIKNRIVTTEEEFLVASEQHTVYDDTKFRTKLDESFEFIKRMLKDE